MMILVHRFFLLNIWWNCDYVDEIEKARILQEVIGGLGTKKTIYRIFVKIKAWGKGGRLSLCGKGSRIMRSRAKNTSFIHSRGTLHSSRTEIDIYSNYVRTISFTNIAYHLRIKKYCICACTSTNKR